MADPYRIELRAPGDNSWVLSAQQEIRSRIEVAPRPEALPAVRAIGGSGSGELVLRVEVEADTAWAASQRAFALAVDAFPPLADLRYLTVSAEALDPDQEARRPRGA